MATPSFLMPPTLDMLQALRKYIATDYILFLNILCDFQ